MVDFELAKWLQLKGFDEPCKMVWDNWNHLEEWEDGDFHKNSTKNGSVYYSAPEQHQVVEWLLKTHSLWIYTYPVAPFIVDDENYPKIVWVLKICSLNQVNFEKFIDADNGLAINHHHSPQEAYSAAFDYIKNNNLI